MADSREQVAALNGAIRDRLVIESFVDDRVVVVNQSGERLGVGDRVATRRNDSQLGIANRQLWNITGICHETVTLRDDRGRVREVPTWYAQSRVELAYATTLYGAQGETTSTSHMVMGQITSAASAYVGMTRGRHDNVAHIVAEDRDQARAIWEQAFSKDRADLGVAHARLRAVDDIDRYGPNGPGHARDEAVARQRAQQRQDARRREFERWRTETPKPARRSRSGPGIGF